MYINVTQVTALHANLQRQVDEQLLRADAVLINMKPSNNLINVLLLRVAQRAILVIPTLGKFCVHFVYFAPLVPISENMVTISGDIPGQDTL
jgi:hypothetical protein